MIVKTAYKIVAFFILTIISLINLIATIMLLTFPQLLSILDTILAIMFYINGAIIQIYAIFIFLNKK